MNAEKIVGKLLGEKKIEAMVQRLDRLTRDESRLAVAQVLEVVHGLVQNTNVVMEGEQYPLKLSRWMLRNVPHRWQGIGRLSQGCTRYVLQTTIK